LNRQSQRELDCSSKSSKSESKDSDYYNSEEIEEIRNRTPQIGIQDSMRSNLDMSENKIISMFIIRQVLA
jgi:hypothetical protein